jgi:hypothetical protein
MAAMGDRVSYLEGKVDEHSGTLVGVREGLAQFEERVDRRFEAVDRRFEAVDRRFESIERRLDAIDGKLSSHFQWLLGVEITTLVAILGALVARS